MIHSGPIYKCHHTMSRAGAKIGHYISDLIFIGSKPHIVIEWMEAPQGDIPSTVVELDPRFLHEYAPPKTHYMYEMMIEDPRSLS